MERTVLRCGIEMVGNVTRARGPERRGESAFSSFLDWTASWAVRDRAWVNVGEEWSVEG